MQLQLFNSLSSKALTNVRSAIVVADARDPEFPIIYMNPAFEVLTGYGPDEVLGQNCRFLQGSDTDQPDCTRIRDALANALPMHAILRNYRKDGTLFYNELFIDPIFDADGALTHFVGCQNEIPEADKAYVLRQSYASLEKLSRREREVLPLLVTGHSNKSVARALQISPRTAEKHRLAIFKKFEVSEITLLVRHTVALGITRIRHEDELSLNKK